jgi:hypothetical protein
MQSYKCSFTLIPMWCKDIIGALIFKYAHWLGSPSVFRWVCVVHLLVICVVCGCCFLVFVVVCLHSVSCAQCCLIHRIVHSWWPLLFSVTFNCLHSTTLTIMVRNSWNAKPNFAFNYINVLYQLWLVVSTSHRYGNK